MKGEAGSEKFLSLANLWWHCVNTETIPVTHEPAKGHSSVSISITQARSARDFWGSHRGPSQRSPALYKPRGGCARVSEPSSPLCVDCYCCADRWLLGYMAHSQTDHIHQNSTLSLFPSHTARSQAAWLTQTHTYCIYSVLNYVHEHTPYSIGLLCFITITPVSAPRAGFTNQGLNCEYYLKLVSVRLCVIS